MTALIVAISVFIIILALGNWTLSRFFCGIARQFPAIWVQLGQPTMWQDLLFLDAGHHILWLFKRQFTAINDIAFIAYCDRRRWPLVGLYAFNVAALLVVFYHCPALLKR